MKKNRMAWAAKAAALAVVVGLSACGGGGGGGGASSPASAPTPEPVVIKPSNEQARRFLLQASFGPTDASIEAVMRLGYEAWIDDQLAKPASSHRLNWDNADAAIRAAKAAGTGTGKATNAGAGEVLDSFYKVAVTGDDQLRQRLAYALSQIFVVSLAQGALGEQPRSVAAYLDMLAKEGTGSYRDLLQQVALHPAMGIYLSHLRNQKEDPLTGRVADENFAREVMQLFSIGLQELNTDGGPKLDGTTPRPSYGPEDVSGLAKVFTGWSWDGPDTDNNRFAGWCPTFCEPDRLIQPMQGYGQYHSISEKRFLGTVVAAQSKAKPEASLKAALDTLAAHPNVGPFIGRQLIQRLVTSHPSPAYVARVAQAFGPSGNMKAMLKAVLLDREAREPAAADANAYGKLREPVLRLTQTLRALESSSDSGAWLIRSTDDPAAQLGQSPLRSPSVFNFYRPGYVFAGGETGAAKLTMPELALVNESSVAGYSIYMRNGLSSGFGPSGLDGKNGRPDVQLALTAESALADKPAELVNLVSAKLLGARSNAELKAEIVAAVESVKLDALKADASNQKTVDEQRRNRARMAVYLSVLSPEYMVQK
ncbi:uncharacterized protein (DUF1800 family) [Paucibacter oligotrophus]|uniref:Uncharacterized protein (DUF1800 family) n=1 Tax=Roseateles oligotrophus TaxID=1769250 RepID=A0A840L439_9BURK|nr:DUF1800 domain-containing protein [Roseateles oligotrophus]MBB4842726.1 uncharacterized protein (DUF1800 family) [Roseateles oligotrophus]